MPAAQLVAPINSQLDRKLLHPQVWQHSAVAEAYVSMLGPAGSRSKGRLMSPQAWAIIWMLIALSGLGLFTVFALLAVRKTAADGPQSRSESTDQDPT